MMTLGWECWASVVLVDTGATPGAPPAAAAATAAAATAAACYC